jgi:hypothetical protein
VGRTRGRLVVSGRLATTLGSDALAEGEVRHRRENGAHGTRLNETPPREPPSRAAFSETTSWTPSQRIWPAAGQRRAGGPSWVRRDTCPGQLQRGATRPQVLGRGLPYHQLQWAGTHASAGESAGGDDKARTPLHGDKWEADPVAADGRQTTAGRGRTPRLCRPPSAHARATSVANDRERKRPVGARPLLSSKPSAMAARSSLPGRCSPATLHGLQRSRPAQPERCHSERWGVMHAAPFGRRVHAPGSVRG